MADGETNTLIEIAKVGVPVLLASAFGSYWLRRRLVWLNNMWAYVSEKLGDAACGSDDKLTVLVAKLDGDVDSSNQNHIRNALRTDTALEVLTTDRILQLTRGLSDSDALKEAHVTGEVWLRDRESDLLVWGEAFPAKDIIRVRFTTRHDRNDTGRDYRFQDQTLQLPDDFNADLGNALITTIIAISSDDVSKAENTAEPLLLSRIPGLERVLDEPPSAVTEDTLRPLRHVLAHAYRIVGSRQRSNEFLSKSIDLNRSILMNLDPEIDAEAWAMTQNNLGNALKALGERSPDTTRLEAAVDAYTAALRVRREEALPLDWAVTQNNLGNALKSLGERSDDTARLEAAVNAFTAALRVRNEDNLPLQWAMTQNNLGTALRALGERSEDPAYLDAAVDALTAALRVRREETLPLDWAMTQNNLGNALKALGERSKDPACFEAAVDAFTAALRVYRENILPLDWAMTKANLGLVFLAKGRLTQDYAPVQTSLSLLQDALRIFDPDVPAYARRTRGMIATAEQTLVELNEYPPDKDT